MFFKTRRCCFIHVSGHVCFGCHEVVVHDRVQRQSTFKDQCVETQLVLVDPVQLTGHVTWATHRLSGPNRSMCRWAAAALDAASRRLTDAWTETVLLDTRDRQQLTSTHLLCLQLLFCCCCCCCSSSSSAFMEPDSVNGKYLSNEVEIKKRIKAEIHLPCAVCESN